MAGSQRKLAFLLLLTAASALQAQVGDVDRIRAQIGDVDQIQVIRRVEWTSFEVGKAPAPDAEWSRLR